MNPNPATPPNQPLKKFLTIYEKMLNDSKSFACKMAAAIKRKSKKLKKPARLS